MIDYLKLEAKLKKFFDYEAKMEDDKRNDKIFKKVGIIHLSFLILSIFIFLKINILQLNKEEYVLYILFGFFYIVCNVFIFALIMNGLYSDENFETDNYETEENLKKVSEFGIKNVTNFKENISLLRRKTEYMILDENFKETKTYSVREIYINKILNIFYGTDKTDLKKQDMELLELLKK